MSSRLAFFGVGSGSPDEIARGKRRAATYFSFLTFVLIVAAMDANDWVTGGVEFDIGGTLGTNLDTLPTEIKELCSNTGTNLYEYEEALSRQIVVGADNKPMLGVTITPMFHLGLTTYTQGGQWFMRYSNVAVDRECYFAIADEINNINAGTKVNGTFWYGLQPLSISTFNSTFGLLGFASFLQIIVWLAFVCIAYDAPFMSTHPKTPLVIRVVAVGSLFFTFVAIVYFGTSGIKASFCNAFDPDTRFNNTFCGYNTGFNIGISALIFTILQAIMLWLWLPADFISAGGRQYEFSGKGDYAVVGTDNNNNPPASTSVPMSAASYQDFGSPSA